MSYKRVLTIQDVSCVGQCSLTVALPILSACGVETCVLPSAVLSTHTGGFSGYTFRDLTDDMPAIKNHWMKEGIRFDAGIVETSIGAQPDIESCALVPAYDKILHDTMPVLYVKTVPKGPMAEKAVYQALYNVFVRDGKSAESNLPSQCVIAEKLPFNGSGKVSIYEIQQNGVKGGRYYRIDPIRIDGKLVDIKLMLQHLCLRKHLMERLFPQCL